MVAANNEFKIGIGCDPEIFVIDKVLKRYTSAHDLVPGTKDNPHPLKNGAVQVDGVALEYNTKPAYSAMEFAKYNTDVLKQLREMVPEDRYDFSFEPAVFFDKVFFDSLPRGPKELGCSPDYNAYTGKMTPSPEPTGIYTNMRTGSGHIHISWTEGQDVLDRSHQWDCNYVVKCLEYVFKSYIPYWDKDTHRVNLYGKPGALRYKPYGVEWRSLSNAWLKHPELHEWLFEAITFIVKKAKEGAFKKFDVDNYAAAPAWTGSVTYQNQIWSNKLPGFPPMPFAMKDVKDIKKTQKVVRISPTMRTTSADIDLDLDPDLVNGISVEIHDD
jgi:hypothetical protein